MDDGLNDGGAMEFAQRGAEEQQREGNMNVYQAICAVAKTLAQQGISKDRKNQQQNYNFRGIDDVYNALAPILAENHLVILPRMISRELVERQTMKGGNLFYVTVEAEFDFVSAADGSKHTVRTFGEAMDSADKATNKAMSAAYKYAAFQAFCIPTEGDNDADATTHDVAPRQRPAKFDPNATFEYIANAKTTRALENLYLQSKEQGAAPDMLAKVADACAARKAILAREAS